MKTKRNKGVFQDVIYTGMLCGAILFCISLWAETQAYTPPAGSPERKAIMNALRGGVQTEFKQAVIFEVEHLKVNRGWAFLRGIPRQPSGRPINYAGTPYQQRIKEGMFDDWIAALLRKSGEKWQVEIYVVGYTDVPYEEWISQYHAPKLIFQ